MIDQTAQMCYNIDAHTDAGRFAFLRQPVNQLHIRRYEQSAPYVCVDVSRPRSCEQRPAHKERFAMSRPKLSRQLSAIDQIKQGFVAPPGHISKAFILVAAEQGLKFCSKCHKALPTQEFVENRAEGDGLARYCRDCKAILDKEQYERVKDKLKKKRTNQKIKLAGLLGGYCARCGYSEFPSSLDFHHIDPDEKEDVGVFSAINFESAKQEIDKCALLCKNCHTAYHSGEWDIEFVKRRGVGWTIEVPEPGPGPGADRQRFYPDSLEEGHHVNQNRLPGQV
jgi:hypothetical protein